MKKITLLFVTVALLLACKKNEDLNESIPSTPVAIQAIDLTTSSFTAKWNEVSNATSYEIELAKDSYFNMMVTTESSNSNSFGFTNLSSNIRYFYRVRAKNDVGVSENSNTINAFTLPEPPIVMSATAVSNTGFTVNWKWSQSITTYLLYISTEDFPHDDSKNISAYNGKTVVSNTHIVSGLNSSTKYYYVLRAANGSNISANSNTISCTTTN